MKKILSILIVLAVVLSCVGVFATDIRTSPSTTVDPTPVSPSTPTQTTPKVTFSDIDANTASGKAIYKLVNAGILNGYTDGTFRPNNPITRAELCKIVNLVFNYTEAADSTFSDVKKDDWFYDYVAIAKKAGYIAGHADGTFKGNDYLTREQTCTIVTRVTNLYDLTMTETITDSVSAWAVPYVNKVVANKLMPLEEGGKFRATENITRAELVTLMANFVVEETEEKPAENAAQYTVTFNTNGGNSISAAKVESGKTVVKPSTPVKAGYTFEGWYSDSGLTKTYDFNSKVTADITLYAKWTKTGSVSGGSSGGGGSTGGGSSSGGTTTTYTVTFNTNGGSSIDNATVNKGDTVAEPEAPTRDGYEFKGWYSNSGLTTAYDFSSKVTKNITIYAKWVAVYTVTFETNGGGYIEPVVVESGKTVDEPEAAEWPGYYFMGWYRESEFIAKYNFSSKVTKNITIYAKWLEEDPEKQQYVVDTMGELIDELDGIRFTLAEKAIVDIAVEVMQLVIGEAANGTPVYDGDYIIENYSDYIYGNPNEGIVGARELYDAMEDSDQTDFYSKLVTELGEERANQLLGILFGMNLEDVKDKIDN